MQINCPHCGLRDISEFTYQGDATKQMPPLESTHQQEWNDFVYGRTNPRGDHMEFWHHSGGCRAHLRIERNTVSHEIATIVFARDVAAS